LSSTWCPGSADVEMGLFMGSLVPLLFRALLTFRFSGVRRTILRHESELAVLANDVGKIGCNAHSVREVLICRRLGAQPYLGGDDIDEGRRGVGDIGDGGRLSASLGGVGGSSLQVRNMEYFPVPARLVCLRAIDKPVIGSVSLRRESQEKLFASITFCTRPVCQGLISCRGLL
jgi:hypothetical protein